MSFLNRPAFLLAAIAVALLAVTACSGNEPATATPISEAWRNYLQTVEASQDDYETCYKPTEALRSDIVRNLRYQGVGLRAFYTVRNSAFSNSWTVGADLEGEGFVGEGPIILFDAIGTNAGGIEIDNIQPFNNIAKEQTTLSWTIDEEAFEGLSIMYKVGLEVLNACIHDELTANPDLPVYSIEP